VQYQAQEANKELRANLSDMLKNLEDAQYNMVDVRSPAEFTGEVIAPPGMTETAQRGGHIPGCQKHSVGAGRKRRRHFQNRR
jgi:thiosulfate/3-mercaptopyruvate sulfurtransferase